MKTHFVTLIFALIVGLTFGHASAYEQKMTEAIDAMKKSASPADFVKAANSFKVISNVAKDEWLPLYYNAYIYVTLVYVDKDAETSVKDGYLESAKASLDVLLEKYPKEVEIQVLDSFYWITRITLGGIMSNMMYMGNYTGAISRALELEPNNPRARFQDLANKIGKAEFFGSDISEYCAGMQNLYDTWDAYQAKSSIHPTWGKSSVTGYLGKCK